MDAELLATFEPADLDLLLAKVGEAHAGLMAEQVTLVAEVLRRQTWRADGCVSAADWVAARLRLSERRARELCRVARALQEMPELHAALAEGTISWDQLVPLVFLVGTGASAADWIELARGASVAQLQALERSWRRDQHDGKPEPTGNDLRYVPDPEAGRVKYWGQAVGDDAIRFLTFIDHTARNHCRPLPGEPEMSWSQRCGDALIMGLSASLGGIDRDRATINVHLDAEAAATNGAGGRASMGAPWEFSLSRSTLERLLCDGRCRTILEGLDGPAAWTSAERPAPAVEQAVLRRDIHCVIRGCRARHGEIHHLVWRSRGGPTTFTNLVFVCWRHHRLIHDGGWQLTGQAGNLTWSRPDGTVVWSTGPPTLAA